MNTFKKVIFLITALLITANLYAQESGKIIGTVVDAETGETLIGVNVVIEGTIQGTATDFDGNYQIRRVAAGTYNIVASYLSYATQTITEVIVEEGATVRLDIVMQVESEFLDEIVVSADAILNSEAGLLRQRQKSIAFSDAISSESISRSGSGDAAGALTKVVGASVVGGKYVYVRGLGDRYSTAHLNGSELPSADPDKNAFQLDLIPSNIIDNIVTLKSFTPDKPGNFSGGLVDVTTKDFPERLIFNISTSVGYNTRTTLEDGLGSERSGTDFLGYDDGLRNIPATIRNLDGPIPEYGDSFLAFDDEHVANSAVLNEISNSFNNEMTPRQITIPFNTGLSISLGNQFNLLNKDVGYILGFSNNRSFSSYSDGRNGLFQLIGDLEDDTILNTQNDYSDTRTSENIDLGGLASLSVKLNQNNKIAGTWIRTQSGTLEGRLLQGYREEPAEGGFDDYSSNVISYTERKLSSFQVNGKHVATSLNDLTFEWKATFSKNELGQPDTRFFEYGINSQESVYSIARSGFLRPQRFFRELDEENKNYIADLTIPVSFLDVGDIKFKTGINFLYGDRTFDERRFAYEQDQASLNDFQDDFAGFFNYTGIDESLSDAVFIRYGNVIQERTNPTNNYIGEKEITAGYLMAEIPVLSNLKVIAGARLENTFLKVESTNEELEDSLRIGEIDVQDILPSVSVIYSLNDKMNIRTAFSKTLARPNYREIAPFSSFDAYGQYSDAGNINLQRTLITNFDLRWEWFTTPQEIIAVSVFYKYLENPIERVFDTQRVRTRTWQNVDEANVYGIELEVRKNLAFISQSLENLSVAANLTLVESSVNISEGELFTARQSDPDFKDTRPLYGQSPYIVNIDFSYASPKYDFTVDLNSNIFGERLSDVTLGANPDVFERSYLSSDLIINKNFGENLAGKISVKNIFDPRIKESASLNDEEYLYSAYNQGRSISLSISYKL